MRHAALVCRFPTDDGALKDLFAASIDGTGAVAVDEPSDREWRVFYSSAGAREAALAAVGDFCRAHAITLEIIQVDDQDWARRSQAQLSAVRVGGLIIAPPWDIPKGSGDKSQGSLIVIEPSTGFGTGHHASTRLCLLALQDLDLRGRTVLDVGTGSGVLAIAAAMLGAEQVLAIDIDAEALRSARENVARNLLTGHADAWSHIDLRVADVTSLEATPVDVLVANLTGAWLQRHAAALVQRTNVGGLMILAGLQERDAAAVLEAFTRYARLERRVDEEGWTSLVLRRVTDHPTQS